MQFVHKPLDFEFKKLKDKTSNGSRYYFDPANPKEKWPSITTVLSDYKKETLQKWRKRVGEKAAQEISTKASNRGNSLHYMIEHYLKNEDPNTFKATPAHKIVFNQTRKILERNISNIVIQEQKLVSKSLKVAGRLDLIAEWEGVLSVIDFKSSNKRKKEEWITNYYMQACFYSLAFWEQTSVLPKQMVILISADDFSVVPYIQPSVNFLDPLKTQVDLWYKNHKI